MKKTMYGKRLLSIQGDPQVCFCYYQTIDDDTGETIFRIIRHTRGGFGLKDLILAEGFTHEAVLAELNGIIFRGNAFLTYKKNEDLERQVEVEEEMARIIRATMF